MDERTLYRTWGQRVRAQREAVGLRQSELADRVGTSQQVISNIETGLRRPSDALRPKIAAVLETTVADLFPYDEVAA